MTTVLNYPSSVKLTTNADFRVVMLPRGNRSPASYTITAAAPTGVAGTVTVSALAEPVSTPTQTLTVVALTAALPAGTILTLGGSAVVLFAAAAAAATTIVVLPLTFTILPNTIFQFNPGALTAGTTMLSVGALPALIDVGTILTFTGNVRVVVQGRSPAGATQLRITPLTTVLTAGNTAQTRALLCVVGLTAPAIPSPEPKVVDTTNLKSGIGMEKQVTAVGQKLTMNYNLISGDLGGAVLTRLVRDVSLYNREFYFESTLEDGEAHYGVAIMEQSPESGDIKDTRKMQASGSVQGLTYQYIEVPGTFF